MQTPYVMDTPISTLINQYSTKPTTRRLYFDLIEKSMQIFDLIEMASYEQIFL